MASQYKRVKLSKTGVVNATRIEDDVPASAAPTAPGDKGDNLMDDDDDDDLNLAVARKQTTGKQGVLDDEDSEDGAPAPKEKPPKSKQSAGASTSKGKGKQKKKGRSDYEEVLHLSCALDMPVFVMDGSDSSLSMECAVERGRKRRH